MNSEMHSPLSEVVAGVIREGEDLFEWSTEDKPVRVRRIRTETEFRRETLGLPEEEAEKYDNPLRKLLRPLIGPKSLLKDVVGPHADVPIDRNREHLLDRSVAYYRREPAELLRVLKYYISYLMRQARREVSFSKQVFLLFKVVDLARMMVQFSPGAIHRRAETIILSIFVDLGFQKSGRFRHYFDSQLEIHRLMRSLAFSPADTEVRLKLADQLVRQTSFLDAFMQYRLLLERYPRTPRDTDTSRGLVIVKIAGIFQNMAHHAALGEYQDARKIKVFIERYNRDFAGKGGKLRAVRSNNPRQIARAARSLRKQANRWYLQALAIRSLEPEMWMDAAYQLAKNLYADSSHRQALRLLRALYPYWEHVTEREGALKARLNFLDMISLVAARLRNTAVANWAVAESADCRRRLAEIQHSLGAAGARRQRSKAGGPLLA
jgi:thioredoxin-like negative regulator of GroEL